MKSIRTRTAAAVLMFAGSLLPAYGQGRDNDRGRDRSDRPQREDRGQGRRGGDQIRGDQGRSDQNQARPQRDQSQGFRQQQNRPQDNSQQFVPQQRGNPQQNFRPQQDFRQRDNRQDFRQQDNRQGFRPQQNFRPQQQQNFRQQNNFRGGNSFQRYAPGRSWSGRSWTDRGGYRGRFIPQTRFYSSFGRQNYFRVGRPVFYNGFARFQYGGFSFQFMDAIPDYWGPNWYDSDDVYVDYQDDGYYMYNNRYPGAGISVSVDF